MIDVYSWSTGNGKKVFIALEEMGLPYTVHPINIYKNENLDPAFESLSPNQKIPVIKDQETDITLFESGAILQYLAEKSGKFYGKNEKARWDVTQWLMWQMSGVGPMMGQALHFLFYNKDASSYAAERYGKETRRLYAVMDKKLSKKDFIAGDYSIADMAIWPWITRYERLLISLDEYPNVQRWYRTISARPAVVKGFKVLAEDEGIPGL